MSARPSRRVTARGSLLPPPGWSGDARCDLLGRSPSRLVLLAAVLALPAACGDGGNGGPDTEPGAEATLTAPSFIAVGDTSLPADLLLRTNRAAAGLQVDVVMPPEVIPSVGGIASAGRASHLETGSFQNLAPGRTRVLLFDPDGQASIPPGDGPVLTLTFAIAELAPPGISFIALENGLVIDGEGRAFELTLQSGEVTVQP